MNDRKKLVLASQSPRRRELIGLLGIPFQSMSADVDESLRPNEDPAKYVLRLAELKARTCYSEASPMVLAAKKDDLVFIGSDTAVVADGVILGKPKDERDALQMLHQLRGRTHQVFTAIALFDAASEKVVTELSISDVPMRDYSDAEIESYVASGDPLDKAGSYAIQNDAFHPVENFNGCYASVMGLPLCHLTRALKKMGITPATNVPAQCQANLAYDCSIYNAVLRDENLE